MNLMSENVKRKCKMPVRFYPGQDIFIPWININGDHVPSHLCRVDRITWDEDEIVYEIQALSNLGHQWLDEIKDTWEENCIAFETEEECEKYIRDFKSDTYNGFNQERFTNAFIIVPFRGSL